MSQRARPPSGAGARPPSGQAARPPSSHQPGRPGSRGTDAATVASAVAALAVGADASAAGPASALPPADITMDQLLAQLQVLDYERDFCRRKKPRRKPLAPGYFAYPARSGAAAAGAANEQFFTFTALAAWLLQGCGAAVANPKEFDDPNATLSAILTAARAVGGGPAAVVSAAPPARLAVGWGPEVCALLQALAAAALERKGFRFGRVVFTPDSYPEDTEAAAGVDDEVGAVDLSEQAAMGGGAEAEGDEEEEALFGGGPGWGGGGGTGAASSGAPSAVGALAAVGGIGEGGSAAAATAGAADWRVLVSTVDPTLWKLEAERLAPRLRLAVPADARDWREHLDAAAAGAHALADGWPDARATLTQAAADVGGALERIAAREAAANSRFGGALASYAAARRALSEARDEAAARADGVAARDAELHRLAAALEEAKAALDARGSSLADASPLVRIKAAAARLTKEIGEMEVRIGVVGHTLVQLSLADKQAVARDVAARTAGGGAAVATAHAPRIAGAST